MPRRRNDNSDTLQAQKPKRPENQGGLVSAFARNARLTFQKVKNKKKGARTRRLVPAQTQQPLIQARVRAQSNNAPQTGYAPSRTLQPSRVRLEDPEIQAAPVDYVPPRAPETVDSTKNDDKYAQDTTRYEPASQEDIEPPAQSNTQLSQLTSQSCTTTGKSTLSNMEGPPSEDMTKNGNTFTIGTDTTLTEDERGISRGASTRGTSSEDISAYKTMSQLSEGVWSEAETFDTFQQSFSWMCVVVSAIQFGILVIQMVLCGVASLDVNPMLGPFPDAFSEWGGKNAYLMLDEKQYYRLFTPVFLHVGVAHFLVNVLCQLEPCAIFEREWGSSTWVVIYVLGGIGSVASSSVIDPDTIAVVSSGAVMALYGAKIAQMVTYTAFDIIPDSYVEAASLDRLGSVFFSLAVVFLLTGVTYIELSGHMGGLVTGFLCGMFMFCQAIRSGCVRFLWGCTGLLGLGGAGAYVMYQLYVETYADEELGDACQYFRNLYPEGYQCECQWG